VKKAKVITICGSLKFEKEIKEYAEKLELEGNCVLNIVYPTKEDKDEYTKKELELFGIMHKQRIDMSDAIFVINVNGYIGSSTKSEIEYATLKNKEIIYLEK
jgi:hypothetical protein